MGRNLFALLLVLAVVPASRAAGQSVDIVVKGVVRDQTGALLSGATITATNIATNLSRLATTDEDGQYTLPPVPPGAYEIRAESAGFRTQVRDRQTLHVGTIIAVDFTLDVAAVTETVAVAVPAPVLETTKNTLTRLVALEEIDSLPVVSRNFNDLAVLVPGVTATGLYGGVDISGSRDFQNGYNVDGVSSESLGTGEQRIGYAQDWIQEFQVLTSQYGAEFGGASGGVLNAVTRSGSNQLAGRAYGFFRNDAWDALPVFAQTKAPLDIKRGGATLGGKLIPNRLFFFTGVERFTNESSNIVNSAFPDVNGSVPSVREQWLYVGKGDYHQNASNTFRVRYNGLRDKAEGVGVGGIGTEEHGRATTYNAYDIVGTWSRVLTPAMFNELRAAFNTTDFNSVCNFAQRNPPGTWFERVYPGGVFGCPPQGFRGLDEFQLIDNLTWARGRHHVKAGVQGSRAHSTGDFRNARDGQYRFAQDIPFRIDDPRSYPFTFSIFTGGTTWDYSWWSWGAFVQDSWRLNDDITLNAGVRYDIDGAYTALNRLVRVERGLNTVGTDRNNISPRVGVAWTPFENARRTLVRASAGVYHDQNHAGLSNLLLSNGILVDRAFTLNAFVPGFNPFWPDTARAQRVLAEALALNTIPDIASIPGSVGQAPDLDPNLQIPYTMQISGGLAHDFGRGVNVSGDVVYSRGLDQYVIRDINLNKDAALAGRVVRPNPNYSAINRYGNGGEFDYRALQVQASWTGRAGNLARLSYTLARNESNTNTALSGIGGGVGATNPFDFEEDRGPTDNDVRHALSANSVTTLPFDIQLAVLLTARSALPYSATTVRQLDSDPFIDRPAPRNSRRGDSYFTLDMRLAKIVRFDSRRRLTAFVELFNVTNTSNLIGYVGGLEATQSGQATAALEKRRTQLGVRFDF